MPSLPSSIPPELLAKYTQQQLADALSALIVADVQHFAAEVRKIDSTVKQMEHTGDGFTPYPRLAAEFDFEVKAVVTSCGEIVVEGRRFIAAMHAAKNKAASLRTRYEEYAKEMRAALGTVERSPRG